MSGRHGNAIVDLPSGRRRPLLDRGRESTLAFSPDGHLLAIGSAEGGICLFDAELGSFLRGLPSRGADRGRGHDGAIRAMAFSPDGRVLASGGDDPLVRIWDVRGKMPFRSISTDDPYTLALHFLDDGKRLVTAGWEGVQIWDATTGVRETTLRGSRGLGVSSLGLSPDGGTLALGLADAGTRLWDLRARRMTIIPAAGGEGLRFSPSGRLLIATAGRSATVWDLGSTGGTPELMVKLRADGLDMILDVSLDEEGERVLALDGRGALWAWSIPSGKLVARRPGMGMPARSTPWLSAGSYGLWLALWIVAARSRRRRRTIPKWERELIETALPAMVGAHMFAGILVLQLIRTDGSFPDGSPWPRIGYGVLSLLVLAGVILVVHRGGNSLRGRPSLRLIMVIPTLTIILLYVLDWICLLSPL